MKIVKEKVNFSILEKIHILYKQLGSDFVPNSFSFSLIFRSKIYVVVALLEKCSNRQFFRSAFSCIWTEYRKIQTRKNPVFGHFFHSVAYEFIEIYPVLPIMQIF